MGGHNYFLFSINFMVIGNYFILSLETVIPLPSNTFSTKESFIAFISVHLNSASPRTKLMTSLHPWCYLGEILKFLLFIFYTSVFKLGPNHDSAMHNK